MAEDLCYNGINRSKGRDQVARINSGKRLLAFVNEYVELCKARDSKKPWFANIAGFCAFAGISVDEFTKLQKRFPDDYSTALAAFEDAALNSGATASLIGMYLKQYGMWLPPSDEDFVCDHDMFGDGI